MSAAPARGPLAFLLKSQSGQWAVVGLGGLYAFPDQARQLLMPAFQEIGLGDFAKSFSKALMKSGEDESTASSKSSDLPTSIIIQTSSNGDSAAGGIVATVAKYAIGAGACWVGFVVLSQSLPEAVQELMPVTRSFFGRTSRFLAKSISEVRKSLEEKIAIMTEKQDGLERKLDGTHDSVKAVQSDLGETRSDISKLGDSMERCEETLLSSNRLQSYTSKGVTLLVRCVASMLPTNDRQVNELAQYIQDGEDMGKRERAEKQARLSNGMRNSTTPVNGLLSPQLQQPPQEKKANFLIRDSQVDDDLCSLEDVHSVLGIGPGGLLKAN